MALRKNRRLQVFSYHLAELALTAFAFISAYYLRKWGAFLFPLEVTDLSNYVWLLPVVLLFWSVLLWGDRSYYGFRNRKAVDDTINLAKVVGVGTFSIFAIITMVKAGDYINRTFVPLFAAIDFLLLLNVRALVRAIVNNYAARGYDRRFLLIVGEGDSARAVIDEIRRVAGEGFAVRGIVTAGAGSVGDSLYGCPVIGAMRDLPALLEREVVDEVCFALDNRSIDDVAEAILACDAVGVDIRVYSDCLRKMNSRLSIRRLGSIPLMTFYSAPPDNFRLVLKRLGDILFAALCLVALSPLFLLTAIAVMLSSAGPVYFRQERAGKNGRKFVLLKFRTMREGAERLRDGLETMNEMNGPVFKIKNDPRLTAFGRFLRRTSIDELPQLWNILKGDMSLVGPRPLPTYEVEKFEFWQRRRMSMKPGLTGLWQVDGRNSVADFAKWMELDLRYIDNWSLTLDFRIILKTIPAVLFRRGAY